MQKRFDKQFDASTLTGVPGVLVNNKYIVNRIKSKASENCNQLSELPSNALIKSNNL